ncbi:MAG: S8 family serine peptidase, partial [Bacteroidota bacterium]
MRINNAIPALLLSVLAFQTAFSQSLGFSAPVASPAHKPGELIVRLTPGTDIAQVVRDVNSLPVSEGTARLARTIVAEWRYYLIAFDESRVNAYALAGACASLPGVESAQLNHQLEYRGVEPNDPDWYQQSDMTLINAPDAWLSSTGGLTPSGDTIVVAVLEKGALFNHPDLAANRYWNWNDLPDGLDNDNNGFPDDFGGWDVANYNDGTGNNGAHGTGVCGIIGAVGNNGTGVAGVNWKVKIMNVSGVEYDDDIIEAYHYVYVVRKQYNESNGAKGAFVVATNASFGYNNQFPDSSPNFTTWCQLYDTLGYVGVLNMGATSNQDVNVDTDGDMPTSCPSEFLITVTNVNKLGSRVPSGYGKISIDLGAPGTGTYSTTNAGVNTPGYGTIGGTSAATPHVTGAVALVYSMGCESFTSDAVSNPVACARRIRDVILNNTAPNPTLKDITTTGGNLDLKLALGGITELCQGKVGP